MEPETNFYTASDLAELARAYVQDAGDTQGVIAEALGISQSAVSQALRSESGRYIRTLGRILERYGRRVEPEPYFNCK